MQPWVPLNLDVPASVTRCPPSPQSTPSSERRNSLGEKCPIILPKRYILGIFYMRHGTDGFTSPPKEGVLRIFSSLKFRRLRPGLNPRTWLLKASTLTPRPPKPLPAAVNKQNTARVASFWFIIYYKIPAVHTWHCPNVKSAGG